MIEYAVYRNGEFIAAGTAEFLAERLGVTQQDIDRMTDDRWRKRFPKMPQAYVIRETNDPPRWIPSRKNDMRVAEMRRYGISFADIGMQLGISELQAKNAYSRITNGRWGEWSPDD